MRLRTRYSNREGTMFLKQEKGSLSGVVVTGDERYTLL